MLCTKTKRVFLSDEKFFIKCFNVGAILDNLARNVEQGQSLKKVEKLQFYSSLKAFQSLSRTEVMEPLWVSKAHSEEIRSLDYSVEFQLLTTSSADKKLKIWSTETG